MGAARGGYRRGERKRWDMWKGLMAAKKEGLCHSIGVASFTEAHLEQLLAREPETTPAVNQIECHPRRARCGRSDATYGRTVCTRMRPYTQGSPLRAHATHHD